MEAVMKLLVVCLMVSGSFGAGWNYDRGDSVNGPDGWGTRINTTECSGARNSPIDINTANTMNKVASKWKLAGWDSPSDWTLKDKTYTVQFDLKSSAIFTEGGSLTNKYELAQFHFHWGANNTAGSEHTVNGESYPMEVHFVHYDTQNADISAAVQSRADDALAAVGFFFEIQEDDNADLTAMIDAVASLRSDGQDVDVTFPSLASFTQKAMDGSFYRYFGGLTTPECNEIVQWTVFKTPIGISESQMATFRPATSSSYGTELYRDPVPLGSRVVTKYTPEAGDVDSGASTIQSVVCTATLLAFTAMFV